MQNNKKVYLNSQLILIITRGPTENQLGKLLDRYYIYYYSKYCTVSDWLKSPG